MYELSLREIQKQSLEILMDIDKVCRNNSLKYCILFGTLIGAIRHGGFIPWDDDIDIGMARKDYEQFLACYIQQGRFRIVNPETEPMCPYMITRISDDRFELSTEFGSDYAIGTFVDVYPYDGIGNTEKEVKSIVRSSKLFSKGLARSLERNPVNAVRKLHKGVRKWILLGTYILPKIIGKNYFRKHLKCLEKKYEYNISNIVGCVCWALSERECFKKEWIEDIINIKFEDIMVMAPKNYEEMLIQNFGDYMKLPPVEERVGHHYYRMFRKENNATIINR